MSRVLDLLRQDDGNLIDLIGQQAVQHRDGEGVPCLEPVKVREQHRTGQTAVGRQYAVGGRAAHRQARTLEMADADLQHAVRCAVINRQLDVDFINCDVAHNAGAGDIERVLIPGNFLRVVEGIGVGGQAGVVVVRGGKTGVGVLRRQALGGLVIAGDGAGGVPLVPPVGHGGV